MTGTRVEKLYRPSLYRDGRVRRRECWAATIDGVWRIERDEDQTTSWSVRHLPSGTILPVTLGPAGQEQVWHSPAGATQALTFGTLARASTFVTSGRAQALLDVALADA